MIPTITENCSDFLRQSQGKPLLKNLSVNSDGFKRIKVRKQKIKNDLDGIYNSAFDYHTYLKQRCVISYTLESLPNSSENKEPFYIFPINGYKFLFSKNVNNSNETYYNMLKLLENKIGIDRSQNVMEDVLKYNYEDTNLYEALVNDCEIIIFGIPYFYAVKKSIVNNYRELIYN